jgi:PAS domain S-box-containing protein/putative nucleotidyltransferase with HDIG domain
MSDEKRTRLLEDLDNVRQRITELEESEKTQADSDKALRQDSERYRHAVDNASLGVLSVDVRGRVKYVNSQFVKKFKLESGGPENEIDLMSHPDLAQAGLSDAVRSCLQTQKHKVFEHSLPDQNGHKSWFRHYLNPIFDSDGSINGVLSVVDDISSQKKDMDRLSRDLSAEQNMSRVLSKLVGTFEIDKAVQNTLSELADITGANRAFLFLVYEKGTKMDNTHEWCSPGVNSNIEKLQNLATADFPWWMKQLEGGKPIQVKNIADLPPDAKAEQEWLSKMQTRSLLSLPVEMNGKLTGFMGLATVKEESSWGVSQVKLLGTVSQVIGEYLEKKRADDMQKARDERFRRLAQSSIEGLFLVKDGVILDANHVVGSVLGFKPSEYQGKLFLDFVNPGDKPKVEKFLAGSEAKSMEITIPKKGTDQVPVELQMRTVQYQTVPLTVVALRDISERKQHEDQGQKNLEIYQNAFMGSIRALSLSLALRDPYAAGHGEGVAELAGAIAQEMGLPEDAIEGLRLTGTIHDIGKISLPAEILSKPGRISDAERMMVENHPQTGYEILKDIKFPWPVAQFVLQHHERMNGTGYPAGLSGNDILLEARILAVADTVDAIQSGRSYRPARGLEDAVEEITKNKGTLYDAKVVDAALKVINTRGYPYK